MCCLWKDVFKSIVIYKRNLQKQSKEARQHVANTLPTLDRHRANICHREEGKDAQITFLFLILIKTEEVEGRLCMMPSWDNNEEEEERGNRRSLDTATNSLCSSFLSSAHHQTSNYSVDVLHHFMCPFFCTSLGKQLVISCRLWHISHPPVMSSERKLYEVVFILALVRSAQSSRTETTLETWTAVVQLWCGSFVVWKFHNLGLLYNTFKLKEV